MAALCLLGSIFNFIRYNEYRSHIAEESPIVYTLGKTTTHTGGRGSHYDAVVIFNGKEYKINSTSDMNADFDKNIYSALYYIQDEDKVISDWDVVLAARLSALFLFGCVVFAIFAFKREHPPL